MDEDLVHQLGMSPHKLGPLISLNPDIASQILVQLNQSRQFQEYLTALVNQKFMTHCFEVFNTIAVQIELPTDFIHLFISKQIRHTQTLDGGEKEKDKVRQARIVSVFILNMINTRELTISQIMFQEI